MMDKYDFIIYDRITIPEMNNEEMVFNAIIARHNKKARNKKEFRQWLDEYLFDRGVKIWKGPIYTFYYKEDHNLYKEYVDFCKKDGSSSEDILSKDEFFKEYLEERHTQTVNEKIFK